jgi:hypothetical protein
MPRHSLFARAEHLATAHESLEWSQPRHPKSLHSRFARKFVDSDRFADARSHLLRAHPFTDTSTPSFACFLPMLNLGATGGESAWG